jgi:hypothetical protein
VTVRAVEPAERLLGGKAETERESCDRCLGFCGTYLLMSVTLVIASFVYITFDLWDSFYADDHIVMMCQLKPGHAAAYQPFCEDSDTKDACERFAETCSWSPGISKEHVNILDYGLNSTISTCSVRLGVNSTNRPSKPDPCHAAMEQDCGASVKGPACIVCMGAHEAPLEAAHCNASNFEAFCSEKGSPAAAWPASGARTSSQPPSLKPPLGQLHPVDHKSVGINTVICECLLPSLAASDPSCPHTYGWGDLLPFFIGFALDGVALVMLEPVAELFGWGDIFCCGGRKHRQGLVVAGQDDEAQQRDHRLDLWVKV